MRNTISIRGAKENNLKNISIEIPRNRLTVITGVSGSGKSSLAFDVLFGEAQRHLLESLSTYAKGRISFLKRPEVDSILGLSPVIAIDQKKGLTNPRSTVGTITEIYTYMRTLFAMTGNGTCPVCGKKLMYKSVNQITEAIYTLPPGSIAHIYAPVYKVAGEDYQYLFETIRKKGYVSIVINRDAVRLTSPVTLDETKEYKIKVLIDSINVSQTTYKQIRASVRDAVLVGNHIISVTIESGNRETMDVMKGFYRDLGCMDHCTIFAEIHHSHFSYNSPEGSCPTCMGLGTILEADRKMLIKDWNKSIKNGGLDCFLLPHVYGLAEHYKFSLDTPLCQLPEKIIHVLFHGTDGEKFRFITPPTRKYAHRAEGKMVAFEGYIPFLNRYYLRIKRKVQQNPDEFYWFKRHMREVVCPECQGKKLHQHRLLIHLQGKTIHELGEMQLTDLQEFCRTIVFTNKYADAGEIILRDIKKRLGLLMNIGLGYLTMNRRSDSLSGGEYQRIKLSTQVSSELMGMLYVLDEPSIGLHPRDTSKVLNVLKKLRDLGNTIIVVEHDLSTIREADHIIELGPGSGRDGGNITAEGPFDTVLNTPGFLTGTYIRGTRKIPVPAHRRSLTGKTLKITGAVHNNLKNINVAIPLGVHVCITGVSGSGKSSLIHDVLYKYLRATLNDPRITPGKHSQITGIEYIKNAMLIDQSPIGSTPRSNPATYIGIFDRIRKLFSETGEAIARDYTITNFSFNNKAGRCEECRGMGEIKTDLSYMPDIRSVCPVCRGRRYNPDLLEITFRGKNISDILFMSVEEGIDFFSDIRLICHKLTVLKDLGLGYLALGQSSATLSGGESQRLKLAKELAKMKGRMNNLYILDEPTTGLHLQDIQVLLTCLDKLVDAGNTIIVIEHHMDMIKSADYVIDLGPGGGKEGGYVMAEGRPEDIASCRDSFTARFLNNELEGSSFPGTVGVQ